MSIEGSSPGRMAWRRFCRRTMAGVSLGFLLLAAVVSVVGPWALGVDPNQGGESPFAAPDARHWMGTDIHGRDLLARVLIGARISLMVGAVGAMVSLVIGVGWGLVAGWRGGRTGIGRAHG